MSESLAAPSLSSPILNTLIFSAAVLFRGSLTFFMPPLPRGPHLARLRKMTLPPCHLGPCPLSPLLLPLAWGGPRRFALALRLAGCPLFPATFSSLRPCAPVEGRPADGLPRWRLPALHLRRRSRAAPRRRVSRAERQPVLPAPLGAVLVGAARALPLPVPARAPLLARLGVLACEAVFPSPVVQRRLAAPCVLPCSFPCF